MSDEHQPADRHDDQAPDPAPETSPEVAPDEAAPAPASAYDDRPAPEEPTQPLAGWRSTPEVQPDGRAYGEASHEAASDTTPDTAPDTAPDATPNSAPGPADRLGAEPAGAMIGAPPQAREQAPPTVPFAPQGPVPPYAGPGPYARPDYARPGFAPPGYPQAGYGQPGGAGRGPIRKVALWVWPAVACLALVVGLLGGLAGGALQDQLTSRPGTVDNGLEGVRTQSAAPLDADNGSVPAVAQALLPSTVQILADVDGQPGGATGSGFVLDREGHVVTNNHVVASAAGDDGTITVIDHMGQRLEATVVGRSAVYDLAVLDVDSADSLEPAALGASQVLRVGDSVIAFGAPLGLSQTVTSGIVSALNRPVTTSGQSDDESSYINAVQTDAAINPGNSGGPLVNLAGEVVGVNSAIATTGGATTEAGNIGVGFAIPIEQVRTTVDQILRTGEAEYPVIGAQVRTGGEPDADGATITEVMPDTPASRAGLQNDDVITSVDGQPVTDGIALIVAIRTHLPGETVVMSVLRGGDERVVEVELDGQVG